MVRWRCAHQHGNCSMYGHKVNFCQVALRTWRKGLRYETMVCISGCWGHHWPTIHAWGDSTTDWPKYKGRRCYRQTAADLKSDRENEPPTMAASSALCQPRGRRCCMCSVNVTHEWESTAVSTNSCAPLPSRLLCCKIAHGQRGMKRGAAEKMRGPAAPRLV